MAYGHKMRYCGDETVKMVPVPDPSRDRYNKLKKKDFAYFIENPDDEAFMREYVKRRGAKEPVLVTDRKGNPVRRFPHEIREEGGEEVQVFTAKRAATGDIFRHTGEFLENGDPEYICEGITDVSLVRLKSIRTQIGKMAMYEEIKTEGESKSDAGIDALLKQLAEERKSKEEMQKELDSLKASKKE